MPARATIEEEALSIIGVAVKLRYANEKKKKEIEREYERIGNKLEENTKRLIKEYNKQTPTKTPKPRWNSSTKIHGGEATLKIFNRSEVLKMFREPDETARMNTLIELLTPTDRQQFRRETRTSIILNSISLTMFCAITGGIIVGNFFAWAFNFLIGAGVSFVSAVFLIPLSAIIGNISYEIDKDRKRLKQERKNESDMISIVTSFVLQYNNVLKVCKNTNLVHMDAQICILILCIFGIEHDIVKHTLDTNIRIDPAHPDPAHPITLHPFLEMVITSIQNGLDLELVKYNIKNRLIAHAQFNTMYIQTYENITDSDKRTDRVRQRYLREYLVARLYQNEISRIDTQSTIPAEARSVIARVCEQYPLYFNSPDTDVLFGLSFEQIQLLQKALHESKIPLKPNYLIEDSLAELRKIGFKSQLDAPGVLVLNPNYNPKPVLKPTTEITSDEEPTWQLGPRKNGDDEADHEPQVGVPSKQRRSTDDGPPHVLPGQVNGGTSKTVAELRRYAKKHKINLHGATKKAEIIAHIRKTKKIK